MDIARSQPNRRNVTRIAALAALAVAVLVTTLALARLRPAAPPVDRNTVVIDTVRRGPLTREVRASGTLVPEEIRWIAAPTDARIERIVVHPGTVVQADTIILELADPEQQQSARDAQWQLRGAEAELRSMRARLESDRLDRQSALARLRAEHEQAKLKADADAELERQGLAAKITKRISESSAEELARRVQFEEERLLVAKTAQEAQLAAQQAQVEQRREMAALQDERRRSLQVRAGIDGVLQQVDVQAGQRVSTGTAIARVARPDRLKAEIRVPETQAKDITIGQLAKVDTRNGVVEARVSRIDPAVREGTVTVDLTVTGQLPAGARPDLTVDATIELERLPDVLSMSRPVNGQEGGSMTLFKVVEEGKAAVPVKVTLGRASATSIEVRGGLTAGDQVLVSDTSSFEKYERIQLN
jgi:HlyD family secretion protein